MGRPRKVMAVIDASGEVNDAAAEGYVSSATAAEVLSGAIPRSKLPALLAEAKAAEDAPLIAAIMAACSV